jgi:hypothetical protein
MVNTPYVTLNDGNKMPQVGFGLWKVDNDTCADTVYNAIKTGYRLFDGACGMYTLFSRFARSLSRQFLYKHATRPQEGYGGPQAIFEGVVASMINGQRTPIYRWLRIPA